MERRPALKVVPDHPELRAEQDDEYEAQLSEGLAVLERLAGHPGNTPPLARRAVEAAASVLEFEVQRLEEVR